MRRIQAIIAALIITGLVALCMIAVGVNALINQNTAPLLNAPSDPASAPSVTVTPLPPNASSAQLQAQFKQYQDALGQYQSQYQQLQNQYQQLQSQNQQLQQQVSDAAQQLQQLQQVLLELQNRGVIRINSDGSIQLLRRGR